MIASGGLFVPTIHHHARAFYIGIYPSPFFDVDGKTNVQASWQLDRMKQPGCTIKKFEIDIKTNNALSDVKEIWGGYAEYDTEGPHIYKCGEYYYLLVAVGGTFEGYLLSIGRFRNIWGPYESYEGNPIMTSDGKPGEYVQNTDHGELLEDNGGRWWPLVLGVRYDEGHFPLGRESFLTPFQWPEDGWPPSKVPNIEDVYIRAPKLDAYSFQDATQVETSPYTLAQWTYLHRMVHQHFMGRDSEHSNQ
ncbi:glycosyl hydrolase [Dactylonectria estremocensis]|uniref:Glycosyl hydrolase n=1 Tax=Dactylonectria estremocensis TaxID=1079267 RepID=A0A9P9EUG2_9HYPO|nr:glycosyl hydrolase [Dactylonectria estremocensis]